jgi:hypothetical protein
MEQHRKNERRRNPKGMSQSEHGGKGARSCDKNDNLESKLSKSEHGRRECRRSCAGSVSTKTSRRSSTEAMSKSEHHDQRRRLSNRHVTPHRKLSTSEHGISERRKASAATLSSTSSRRSSMKGISKSEHQDQRRRSLEKEATLDRKLSVSEQGRRQ